MVKFLANERKVNKVENSQNVQFRYFFYEMASPKMIEKTMKKMKAKFDPPLDAELSVTSKTERNIELLEKYSEIVQKDPVKAMIEIENKHQALEVIDSLQNYIGERNIEGYNPILDSLWELINEEIIGEDE